VNHPLCVECERVGKLIAATIVDHIISHKGDPILFWDESNWQALCRQCHNRKTAETDGRWGGGSKSLDRFAVDRARGHACVLPK
jgi:5-methylcytosine-specific restriction protein A